MKPVNFPPRPTALAHMLLREVIAEGDTVIDATAGNGHDTLFLAECVGATGRVLAFDVQAEAITAASARIDGAGWSERVSFFQESHSRLHARSGDGVAAVVLFNLGYLPGQDHALTTEAAETLVALEAATRALGPRGVLVVVCYPGHPAGAVEAAAVEDWCASLERSKWRVSKYQALGTLRPAPFLLLCAAAG